LLLAGNANLPAAIGKGEDMYAKACAAALLASLILGLGAARADDLIKPGNWEYTTTMQMPNMPQLPPGVQLPPNVQMQSGPGGMTMTATRCVKSGDAANALKAMRGAEKAGAHCTTDRQDRSGDTMTWAITCSMPDGGTMHTEGTAHYSGDSMDADVKSNMTSSQGAPIERTMHVSGRYLGQCGQ
jgi:hypothetical protein